MMPRRLPQSYGILVLTMFCLAACGTEQPGGSTSDASNGQNSARLDAEMAKELASLKERLGEERRARLALEKRIEELDERLEASRDRTASSVEQPEPDGVEEDAEEVAALDDESFEESSADSDEKPAFDMEALVSKGLSEYDAERLRERWEQYTLDKVYLDDQASREGWRRKPQHYYARQKLEQEIRDELGDEGWDQMLYASGQDNRVVVRDVLGGSAAELAGLEPGDTILRYDGAPIYKVGLLQRATTKGQVGETVSVEVLRDGEVFSTNIDRGPLGTMLRADRQFPAEY